MNQNPYQPPRDLGPPGSPQTTAQRPAFVLAAIGAWLASAYWAGMTLLITGSAALGSRSPVGALLPMVLIVLYALRGWQIFKGDPAAAKRIIVLHGVGGVVALLRMAGGGPVMAILNGIKVAIHIFGGVTAYMASRAYAQETR